jgi:methylated-DNA-[protein]-cysteine S-methyltransferase
VASDAGLHALLWPGQAQEHDLPENNNQPTLVKSKQQLSDYFDKKRTHFNLPLAPQGTTFQLQVWEELKKIPYGETINYGEQAARLGDKNKARAVGLANGKNPLSIIVPCHRVIGKNGSLTGFGGGLDNKAFLLELEKSH